MNIKELIFDENDLDSGILAVSFVEYPAIEKDFNFFNSHKFARKEITDTPTRQMVKLKNPNGSWKYWKYATTNNEDAIIDTSHEFCKAYAFGSPDIKHGNKGVYTIEEINGFHLAPEASYDQGWQTQSTFTMNFTGLNVSDYNLHQQIFNCRHFLEPVMDIQVARQAGINLESHKKEAFSINFAVSNEEQRIVKGVAMIPNVLIYRRNPQTNEEYYVFFNRETIKKLKNKYGYNREITIQHEENITGNAILLDSYIYPDDKNDNAGYNNLKEGSWILEYKILNTKLWDVIKNKGVKGFSVEALLPFNE